MDPSSNELSQAYEGMGACRGQIGVVRGGQGVRPVREEELLGSELEARIRWDNPRNRGEVVHQIERDGG